VTFGAVFLLAFIIDVTDGFGRVNAIPAANNIDNVYINYNFAIVVERDDYYYGDFFVKPEPNDMNYIKISTGEGINAVLNLHNSIIQNCSEHGSYPLNKEWEYVNIRIIYELKGGRTLVREYSSILTDSVDYLTYFELTEEYKDHVAAVLPVNILGMYDRYILEREPDSQFNYRWGEDIEIRYKYSYKYNTYISPVSFPINNYNRLFYAELAEVMSLDIYNDSLEKRINENTEEQLIMTQSRYGMTTLVIRDYFFFTRTFLESRGVELPEFPEYEPDEYIYYDEQYWDYNEWYLD
jgi:hypothetical protein